MQTGSESPDDTRMVGTVAASVSPEQRNQELRTVSVVQSILDDALV